MKITPLHPWDVSPAEAMKIQERLRSRVSTTSALTTVCTVAGVDIGIQGEVARAAVVVLRYPDLTILEKSLAELPVPFPYIPGLLAFREAPAILAACAKLQTEPDLFIFDGQGLAHPRRMGIASHVGVILDRPSIGCAKSRLTGTHATPPPQAGAWVPLYDGAEVIGAVVRSRANVSPLYVSIGHKVDLETAVQYVLSCCRGYRLPETTRQAHLAAGRAAVDEPEEVQGSLFNL